MARSDRRQYELTEAEQRDLVTLIREGKPLPELRQSILDLIKMEHPDKTGVQPSDQPAK